MKHANNDTIFAESKSTSVMGSGKDKQCGDRGSSKLDVSKPKKLALSQSSNSNNAMSMSPKMVSDDEGLTKPKKPKLGVGAEVSSVSNSQTSGDQSVPDLSPSKDQNVTSSKSRKKPKFGVEARQKGGKLSDLAQELGELLVVTEQAGCKVDQLKIPDIKPKKVVPIFGKAANKTL